MAATQVRAPPTEEEKALQAQVGKFQQMEGEIQNARNGQGQYQSQLHENTLVKKVRPSLLAGLLGRRCLFGVSLFCGDFKPSLPAPCRMGH